MLRLEARIGLVDDIDDALAAHDLAIAVTTLERLERAADFHWFSPDLRMSCEEAGTGQHNRVAHMGQLR